MLILVIGKGSTDDNMEAHFGEMQTRLDGTWDALETAQVKLESAKNNIQKTVKTFPSPSVASSERRNVCLTTWSFKGSNRKQPRSFVNRLKEMNKEDRRSNNENDLIPVTSPFTHVTLIAQSSYPPNLPLGLKSPSVLDTLRLLMILAGIISSPQWAHDSSLLPISLPKLFVLYVTNAAPLDMSAKTADNINAASVIITSLNILSTIVLIIIMDLLHGTPPGRHPLWRWCAYGALRWGNQLVNTTPQPTMRGRHRRESLWGARRGPSIWRLVKSKEWGR